MRVIAGKTKGHQLKVPKQTTTRPATDLVRGAIFSILENITDDWSYVLDLFSGSGALGIEALSRGAGWVDFVDHDPRCCAIIRQNLEKTKFEAQAQVHCTTVEKAITRLDKEYKVILIDPPYANLSIGKLLTDLAASKVTQAKIKGETLRLEVAITQEEQRTGWYSSRWYSFPSILYR